MGNSFLKLLPFFVVAITTKSLSKSLQVAADNRGGFGDSCSKTIKCKSQSWLICNPETSQCACAKPDEMIYDNAREKCVGIIGERCKFGFAFDDESLGSFYEKLDCVEGAICESNDGICACPKETYEVLEENKCLPVKSLGSVCHSTNECNNTLICLNGKCDCASANMVFESTSGTCRLKAGELCPYKPPILFKERINVTDCVTGSECVGLTCTCIAGMYMSSGNSNRKFKIECRNNYF